MACLPSMNRSYAGRAALAARSRREGLIQETVRPQQRGQIRSAILPTSSARCLPARLDRVPGAAAMLERLEQQKKLTANQWRIILTTNLGDMLDFFDFFLIGYVLAFILKEWHITYGQSAIILISAGLGAVPGAFFWGWMGDRIGRRTVFMLTALNVAIATGIMYFTPDQNWLIPGWAFLAFFRFFVGFGNAGMIAVDIPLVQEFVPTYKRGWVAGLTTTLLPAGNVL